MKKVGIILGALASFWAMTPVWALELKTGKTAYWRYELVDFVAALGQSETAEAYPARLEATVRQDDEVVESVGGLKKIILKKQTDGTWRGVWPIPFNPELGDYTARVSVLNTAGVTKTANTDFKVQGKEAFSLPKGFSVVTDEGGRQGPSATPGFTSEEPKSWKNMIRWADYMGADAFWECIGQTQVWGTFRPENFPWPQGMLSFAKKVGQYAHESGLKYGAWITAFVVIGHNVEATGYQFTTGYDKATGTLRPLHYVSLGCEQRIKDIIGLLKEFEAAPEIDYMGLDYMRTDFGGYEFADEFVHDMSIPAPDNWERFSAQEKALWMARLIEVTRSKSARERFEWWRAHKVALVVTRVLAEVKPTKPIWVFSLGWVTGHEHGQDVGMMRDAGISFNAPMFYSLPKESYAPMVRDWVKYLKQTKLTLVVGECVDWNLLGRTLDPPGPQEHFDRQLEALKGMQPLAQSFGFFWHDVARAHYGSRGPYGTQEWVLSGAATFSELRAQSGRIPYQVRLGVPKEMVINQPARIRVEVVNAGGNSLTGVTAEILPLPRLQIEGVANKMIGTIGAGESRSVSFTCSTDQIYAKNGGKQMLAVKVKCAQTPARDAFVKFIYLPVAATLPDEGGTTSAARGNTPASVR
ncbi:MAG: hypothetical protein HGA76_09410 [Candidatus Firestonebacteria bacterium]|nr:hypothetical protein [Candidatus Firestonebacteria bacterium]